MALQTAAAPAAARRSTRRARVVTRAVISDNKKKIDAPGNGNISATGASLSGWTPTSWRQKEALQQPNYDNQEVGPGPRPVPSAATWV